MIVSEGYLLIASFLYISRRISTPLHIWFVFKAIIVSALMGVGLMLLRDRLPIWVLIPLAIAFYFATMAIIGEIKWKKVKKSRNR